MSERKIQVGSSVKYVSEADLAESARARFKKTVIDNFRNSKSK